MGLGAVTWLGSTIYLWDVVRGIWELHWGSRRLPDSKRALALGSVGQILQALWWDISRNIGSQRFKGRNRTRL